MSVIVFIVLFIVFWLLISLIAGLVLLIVFRSRKKTQAASVQPVKTVTSEETESTGRSLAQSLKEHRNRCGMTQELVAEKLDISRQAVSKWESGASEPSTSNLIALAKLYNIDLAELLKDTQM